MKRKLLKKLCIYAVSASMMLPTTVPVAAAKPPTIATSQEYTFNMVHSMNYSEVLLYKGDTLQLKSSYSKEKINKVPGKLRWVSSNPQLVSVSSTGKITAKKESYRKPVTIYLKKGNTFISEFETSTRLKSRDSRTSQKG